MTKYLKLTEAEEAAETSSAASMDTLSIINILMWIFCFAFN